MVSSLSVPFYSPRGQHSLDVLPSIMTTSAISILLPDLKQAPHALSMKRSVQTFSQVVRNLQEEINITDCKVYIAPPRPWGHRHELTTVTANVHGWCYLDTCLVMPDVLTANIADKEVQIIFQRMGDVKTGIEEASVTVYLGR